MLRPLSPKFGGTSLASFLTPPRIGGSGGARNPLPYTLSRWIVLHHRFHNRLGHIEWRAHPQRESNAVAGSGIQQQGLLLIGQEELGVKRLLPYIIDDGLFQMRV